MPGSGTALLANPNQFDYSIDLGVELGFSFKCRSVGMREIGIGDMAVPRRVKKAAAALHEQIETYREAIANPSDGALIAASEKYVFLGSRGDASALARYIRRAANDLAQQPWATVAGGRVTFPAFQVSA